MHMGWCTAVYVVGWSVLVDTVVVECMKYYRVCATMNYGTAMPLINDYE